MCVCVFVVVGVGGGSLLITHVFALVLSKLYELFSCPDLTRPCYIFVRLMNVEKKFYLLVSIIHSKQGLNKETVQRLSGIGSKHGVIDKSLHI